VGNWVADFYEATGSTVLNASFTQTQRAIRLWAADFTSFGLNASNIGNIAYFKITLSGSSDIAFVAYNASTVTVQQVLDLGPGVRNRVPGNGRQEEITSLSVYPNPAKGFVSFLHPQTKTGDKILLYDQNGVLLMQTIPASNSTRTKFGISSLRPGTYYVIYISREDRFQEKLVVI
jgi:hypothetical protein